MRNRHGMRLWWVLLLSSVLLCSLSYAATLPSGPYDTSHVTCTSHQGDVDAFRVYCGPQSGVYSTRISTVPQPGTELVMLAKDATGQPGTFFCLCTVLEGTEESIRSIEVGFQLVQTPVDTIKPTVAITAPENGAQVSRNTTITIRANASDNVAVSRVEFRVNSALRCTDGEAAYTCNWKVPEQKNITYTLQARAYDTSGNFKDSAVVTVRSK